MHWGSEMFSFQGPESNEDHQDSGRDPESPHNDPVQKVAAQQFAIEIEHWSKQIKNLSSEWGNNPREQVLHALSQSSEFAADVASLLAGEVIVMGLHGLESGVSERLEDLGRCADLPERVQGIVREVIGFVDQIAEADRILDPESKIYRGTVEDYIARVITACPEASRAFSPEDLNKLKELFETRVRDRSHNHDQGSVSRMISSIREASVTLHRETEGAFDIDWLLDGFVERPEIYSVRFLRTSVELYGHRIDEAGEYLDMLEERLLAQVGREDPRDLFYNQDYYRSIFTLYRQASILADRESEIEDFYSQLMASTELEDLQKIITSTLLESSGGTPSVPGMRIGVGGVSIDIHTEGAGSSQESVSDAFCGPDDRDVALERLFQETPENHRVRFMNREGNELDGVPHRYVHYVGDEALRALADANVSERVAKRWGEVLAGDVRYQDQLRDIYERMQVIAEIYPDEYSAICDGLYRALEFGMQAPRAQASSLMLMAELPFLSDEQQVALQAHGLDLLRRGEQPRSLGDPSEVDSKYSAFYQTSLTANLARRLGSRVDSLLTARQRKRFHRYLQERAEGRSDAIAKFRERYNDL
jgi:hypothetical protein